MTFSYLGYSYVLYTGGPQECKQVCYTNIRLLKTLESVCWSSVVVKGAEV